MAQFKAMAQGVSVNGQTVLSIVSGMPAFKDKALEILKKHGIANIAPDAWYPQQAWLDSFKEIAEVVGANTLFTIGTKIPESAKFPPEIDAIEKALSAIDVAYHMNHKGGEIGHYLFKSTGPKSASVDCPNPYPCEFDRGIIESMAKKFKPAGSFVMVKHDDTKPCRKKGGESCSYLVQW